MSLKTLKWAAILCFIVGIAVLLGGGIAMKKDLPPYPGKVVDSGGKVLFEKPDIIAGLVAAHFLEVDATAAEVRLVRPGQQAEGAVFALQG